MKQILFLLLFISLSTVTFSQRNNQFSLWGNIGGGLSYLKYSSGTGGFSINYGLTSRFDKWIIGAKYRNESEFTFDNPNEEFNSTSMLFGISNKLLKKDSPTELNVNILMGISYVEIYTRGKLLIDGYFGDKYELIRNTTVGIPIEFEMEFRFSNYVGISMSVFSNINKSKNLFGTNLNLLVGYL